MPNILKRHEYFVLGIIFLLVIPVILSEFDTHRFYADEWDHWSQLNLFLNGKFELFNKITMIPGYHYALHFLLLPFDVENIGLVRSASLILTLPSVLFFYLIISRYSSAPISGILTLQYLFCPLFLPFFFLIYTDIFSITIILCGAWLFMSRRWNLAAIVLCLSMLVRQTNVIWLGMFYLMYLTQHGFFDLMPKEALIYSSCRRRPASSALNTMDPGLRRDDDKGINQRLFKHCKTSIKSMLIILVKGGIYWVGILLFIFFIIINDGVAIGDAGYHQLAKLYPTQIYFLLLVIYFLYLPIHIRNIPKILNILKLHTYIWVLGVLAFAFIMVAFSADHPYNTDENGSSVFLHNYFVFYLRENYIVRALLFIGAFWAALSLAVTPLKEKYCYWIYPVSIVSILPIWMVEPRYFMVPIVFFMLYRKPLGEITESLALVYQIPLSVYLVYGIVSEQFFL